MLCICVNTYSQQGARNRSGAIKGVVTDKATNTPIAGAILSVVNDTITVIANDKGEYLISNVRPGYVTLYVVADAHHALLTESFMVTASSPAAHNIAMTAMNIEVKEVTVIASPLIATSESPVSMRRIGVEEIEMTPGANRDISKVAQSSPGVVTTPMQRNDILVRGGGANENKYYLDGIEIPVLNHFAVQGGSGGNASLVNTDMLSSVNFYTGAFPSAFANGLSSVMDMRMKNGNSERFKAKATLGASDVGVSIDTPVSKNGKTTLLASYRRSYLQMLFKVLGLPFLPTYNDYQFKLSTKFDSGDELYFIGLGSTDNNRLNKGIEEPDESQQYILGYLPENNQSSYVIGAGYRHPFKGGIMKVVLSRNYFKNELYKYEGNESQNAKMFNYDTRQADYKLRAEVERWFDSGYRLSAGIGAGTGRYENTTMRLIDLKEQGKRQDNYSTDLNLWRYEAFATLSKRFFAERLSLSAGLRIDGMDYNSKTRNPFSQLSPRLAASYNFNEKWSINGSVARYYQEPTYTMLGYKQNDVLVNRAGGIKYIAANHYIAGVEFKPNSTSRLSLEGFYKAYSDYPVSLNDSLPVSTGDFADYSIGDVPVRSVGKGRAYGAEFSYRNLDFHNTVINFSYTFLYSQFKKLDKDLKPTNVYQPSSWDVRHIVNVSAIHKFNRNWVLGAKWYFIGGFPYTPYDMERSANIASWDIRNRPYIDYALYNGAKGGAYHQLDVRVDKMWFFKHWRLGFYIDIQNLYNFAAKGQDIYMPETDPTTGGNMIDPTNPTKYKMKSVKNDVGGTILPTLGIVIEF